MEESSERLVGIVRCHPRALGEIVQSTPHFSQLIVCLSVLGFVSFYRSPWLPLCIEEGMWYKAGRS